MFRISKYTDISYSYTIFFNLISTSLLVHKIIVDVTWRHRESCCDDDYDGPKEIVWVDLESWSWSLLPSDWFLPRILSLNLFLNFSLNLSLNLFFNFSLNLSLTAATGTAAEQIRSLCVCILFLHFNLSPVVFFDDFSAIPSKYLPKFWVREKFWLS